MNKYPGGGRLKRKEAQRKRQHSRAVKRRRKKGHSSVPSTAEGLRAAYKKGGKFPDLNKDGKVTKADILKGRGVFKKGGFLKNMARTPFGKGLLEVGSQMGGVTGMLSARKQAKQAASEAGLSGKDAKRAIRRQTMAGFLPGALGSGLRKGMEAKDMANPTPRKGGVLVENGGRVPSRKTKRLQRKAKRLMRKQQLKARGRYENGGKFSKSKRPKKMEEMEKKSVTKVRNVPKTREEFRAQRDAKKLKNPHSSQERRYKSAIDKANKGLRAKAKVKKAKKKIAGELKGTGLKYNYEPGRTKGAQRRFDRFSKRLKNRTARRRARQD